MRSNLQNQIDPTQRDSIKNVHTAGKAIVNGPLFDYRVARETSIFVLRASAEQVAIVAFHGQVFIDSATRSVRRITEVVDDVPKDLPIHAASVSVDYDYVAIINHDYMLPVAAQVTLRRGRKETDLNEIEFRNFRRFGSNVRILDSIQEVKP